MGLLPDMEGVPLPSHPTKEIGNIYQDSFWYGQAGCRLGLSTLFKFSNLIITVNLNSRQFSVNNRN